MRSVDSGTSCTSRATRTPGCRNTRPASGCRSPLEDLQQRRLAGAVAADDGDPLAGIDLERDLVEQRQVAEGDGDTVERNEGHGISASRHQATGQL